MAADIMPLAGAAVMKALVQEWVSCHLILEGKVGIFSGCWWYAWKSSPWVRNILIKERFQIRSALIKKLVTPGGRLWPAVEKHELFWWPRFNSCPSLQNLLLFTNECKRLQIMVLVFQGFAERKNLVGNCVQWWEHPHQELCPGSAGRIMSLSCPQVLAFSWSPPLQSPRARFL